MKRAGTTVIKVTGVFHKDCDHAPAYKIMFGGWFCPKCERNCNGPKNDVVQVFQTEQVPVLQAGNRVVDIPPVENTEV